MVMGNVEGKVLYFLRTKIFLYIKHYVIMSDGLLKPKLLTLNKSFSKPICQY